MNLLDALAFVPLPGERGLARRARNEQLAAFVATFGVPMIEIALTVRLHMKDPKLLCMTLPLCFGVAAYFVCRLLRARVGYSLGLSLGCALMCFCWGVFLVILNLMTWSY